MAFSSQQSQQPTSQHQHDGNWLWSEIQQTQQQRQQYMAQALGEEQQQEESSSSYPLFDDGQQQETSRSSFWESQDSNHHHRHGTTYHNNHGHHTDENNDDEEDEYDNDAPTTTAAAAAATTTAPSAAANVVVDHDYSPATVLHRIEQLTLALVDCLEQERLPAVSSRDATENNNDRAAGNNAIIKTQFSLHQARSMTSLFLVLSYCFGLLQQGKTTTLREVYYCFVTHFRHQRECCAAIRQATLLLGVPRHALGLTASPRGWYCGDVQILKLVGAAGGPSNSTRNSQDSSSSSSANDEYKMVMDGRNLQSMHGCPIDAGWLVMPQQLESSSNNVEENNDDSSTCPPLFQIQTVAAQFILVVEKEGIYNRLSEDRFFDTYPCILVTGKGFPDFATRALVHTLHKQLQLPVYGLVDCNPFGIQILNTYRNVNTNHANKHKKRRLPMHSEEQEESQDEVEDNDSDNEEDDDPNDDSRSNHGGVPVQWLGLRPSQLNHFKSSLPAAVFQPLTDIDRKRLYALLSINEADILEEGDEDHDGGQDANGDNASDNEDMDEEDDDDLASMSSSVMDQQHPWIRQQNASRRRHELQLMLENNCKVELEALHWLGMDALSEFLGNVLEHEQTQQQQLEERNAWGSNQEDEPSDDDDETSKGTSWMDII